MMKSTSSKTNKKTAKKESSKRKTRQCKASVKPAAKATIRKQATAIEKVKNFVREKFKKKPETDPDKLEAEIANEQEDQKKTKKN